jgi:protein SCO1/2
MMPSRSRERPAPPKTLAHYIAALILALGASIGSWASPMRADETTLGGPFELIDQDGLTRTAEDFRGSYPLVYFGFTHCPDLCPTSLTAMSRALDDLAQRTPAKAARVIPVFITVDPERDTVAAMKDYVANFHPRLVGLTGSREQIDYVTRSYGAFSAPVPSGNGEYLMDHSGFIVLMGPGGEYLTHFESHVQPAELVEELDRRVAE